MSKKRAAGRGIKSTLTATILSLFGSNPFKSLNYKQVSKALSIKDKAGKDLIYSILIELAEEGKLAEQSPYRYVLGKELIAQYAPKQELITGRVDMKSTGKAYVIPEKGGEDVFVAPNNTGHALHGDLVRVQLFPKRPNRKTEGEIVELLERKKTDFVGVISVSKNFGFLVPDSSNMPVDIFVPKEFLNKAVNGEKVIVRLTDWPEGSKNPFGEVIRVLGKPGDNSVEMQGILAEYGFPLEFSAEVEKEVATMKHGITKDEIARRRDFREVFTITIDPEDAKDFDDALSLRKSENGNTEIGIHIADVSFYVKEGSITDLEARERGTSIYLVDRTIPMLPEKLSNNICSLRPHEEKLCFSTVFEMDDNANIISEWIGRTIIKSDRRYNYDEIQTIIDKGEGDYTDEILQFHELATKLRQQRMIEGSINFQSEEVKFILDKNGKPVDAYIKTQTESNMLIEDFMLLANRKIAERIGKPVGRKKVNTFVYRIHDEPNPEKLHSFLQFIGKLGYSMNISSRKNLVKSYNDLFRAVEGKGEKNLVETIAIRTMAKAEYSTQNIGHYGLAFDYYTHFTSPIRRYPDLMVHRLIDRYLLQHKATVKEETYESICKHASEMEKRAAEMERESVKYKQAEYLSDKIGKQFNGLISGVSKWGIFVEIIESKSEGMVRYNEMPGDYYYLDEENYQVIGQRYGKIFRLGDPVRIRVKNVDLLKKQIDFVIVDTGQQHTKKTKQTVTKKHH
ncbi:MAG: ribonuclease R [Bacteroidales bacterium]|jgi:ribonuclease R|nr:ribonuclease R [Bacteroidales bacterium]MDD3702284.1 ribonuclease R [Bacteroidales bacterium]MDY0369556.1 ribonuclease R [Bacteroidales bacterium]